MSAPEVSAAAEASQSSAEATSESSPDAGRPAGSAINATQVCADSRRTIALRREWTLSSPAPAPEFEPSMMHASPLIRMTSNSVLSRRRWYLRRFRREGGG